MGGVAREAAVADPNPAVAAPAARRARSSRAPRRSAPAAHPLAASDQRLRQAQLSRLTPNPILRSVDTSESRIRGVSQRALRYQQRAFDPLARDSSGGSAQLGRSSVVAAGAWQVEHRPRNGRAGRVSIAFTMDRSDTAAPERRAFLGAIDRFEGGRDRLEIRDSGAAERLPDRIGWTGKYPPMQERSGPCDLPIRLSESDGSDGSDGSDSRTAFPPKSLSLWWARKDSNLRPID